MHIPEQLGSQRNAVIQTHTKRGLHGSASGVGLFLGHSRLEGQSKLRVIIQREDGLTFKENTNRWITLGKVSDNANEIHHITSKTRNTLRDNHVDFAAFRICNHFKELLTLIQRSTGNTFISIDLDECPMRMLYNKVLVILLLQLKGSGLPDIVRGNTNIDSNSLRNIVVVVIGLFDLGYVVVVIRIDLNMDTPTLFILGSFLLISFIFINHGATPRACPPRNRANTPIPRGRNQYLVYPLDSRKQG